MIVGIVGSEASKFTDQGQHAARNTIRSVITAFGVSEVCSGESPLGGIDWWAREEAEALGVPFTPYAPAENNWLRGFKPRNLQIAEHSDLLVCITVLRLPPGYRGMHFPEGCYHCGTPPEDHVKSGGCWTLKQAARLGKQTALIILDQPESPERHHNRHPMQVRTHFRTQSERMPGF